MPEFKDDLVVIGACQIRDCIEYKVPKRYPIRMSYIDVNGVQAVYMLEPRCRRCGAALPPNNMKDKNDTTS